MKLLIPESQWETIIRHLLEKYPEEGCGLLLGKFNKDYLVKEAYPTENVWENKEERKRRYALSPREWLEAEKKATAKNLEILGIFHSHPNYPAYPSPFDLEMAWEGYVYLIAEIKEQSFSRARAYLINASKEIKEIPIEITKGV